MDTAARIRKLGFKRWYERQLIEGHAFLVSALLGGILFAASIEAFKLKGTALQNIYDLAVAFAGGIMMVYGMSRYMRTLGTAEHYSEGAVCPHCREYAKVKVLESGGAADLPWLRLRCRECGQEWVVGE